jgi:nucleotidyltransferase-like protein
VVTQERADEVRTLLATLRGWAQGRPDVVAAGLVGSWARGDARMDSDVDVVLLPEERAPYLEDDAWVYEMGGVGLVWTRRWGTVTERRLALPSGLEVELGVALPSWAATDPVDEGTRRVVTDGVSVVYDPKGILARLLDACGRPEPTDGFRGSGGGDA